MDELGSVLSHSILRSGVAFFGQEWSGLAGEWCELWRELSVLRSRSADEELKGRQTMMMSPFM